MIIAFNLYCKIPFSKSVKTNPEVIKVANLIGRTPSSVAFKLGNFGSFDPELKKRGIVGLRNAGKLDKEIWDEQIDVGFGDAVTSEAEEVELNTILEFPAPRVRIYPKETIIAEKFEAMVSLGLGNGRMKDFWDLNYLIKHIEFDGKLLQNAIRNTFINRQTKLPLELPIALTDDFAANELKLSLWSGFIRRNNIKIETDFAEVIKHLRGFFTPLVEDEAKNIAFDQTWLPQSGWHWLEPAGGFQFASLRSVAES